MVPSIAVVWRAVVLWYQLEAGVYRVLVYVRLACGRSWGNVVPCFGHKKAPP